MIYHYDIEQGTTEWNEMRSGKITASIMKSFFAKGRDTNEPFGKVAMDHLNTIVGERTSGQPSINTAHSLAIKRGHDFEEDARRTYQIARFVRVRKVGFVESDCHTYGCSPDGLVGDDGMIEIKVYSDVKKHVKAALGKNKEHIIQIQFQLFCTGRQWCDYVSYYPEAGAGSRLQITRYYPDYDMFKQFEYKLGIAEAKIVQLTDQYLKSKLAS